MHGRCGNKQASSCPYGTAGRGTRTPKAWMERDVGRLQATDRPCSKLWAAPGAGPGEGGEGTPPLSVHIPEKFLSFAIMNSVPSFERACEIFICSLEHDIF